MSAYSLAHVVDVPGWPTIWGLEPDQPVEGEMERLKDEVSQIRSELASITGRLSRLQSML